MPNSQETTITESIKVYPRGRGKVLIIAEKSVKAKPKNKSKNPSYLHAYIKSNPEAIKLKEYINSDEIKRILLFPEGRQLSYEERLDLAASLLVTCQKIKNYILPETSGKSCTYQFDDNVRKLCNQKLRRYIRWRNRLS